MTTIDEKQAYIMGFIYNRVVDRHITETLSGHISGVSETTLKMYKFVEYKMLKGNRKIDFLRGFFDNNGVICNNNIEMPIDDLKNEMKSIIDSTHDNGLWTGVNALEFLASIYYPGIKYYRKDNYQVLIELSNPHVWSPDRIPSFKWKKGLISAIPPSKNRYSDSGYDLTVVEKIKEKDGVYYYDTGIQVQPDNGYYFEVVGRSSISKTGWMIANNIGVIDASYRGNIIIALVRVNKDAVEITLPMRLAQMIPRQLVIMNPVEVDFLNDTTRGNGGFGSSG